MFVVVGERLIVIVDLRQVRVGENVRQNPQLAALTRLQLAVGTALPAAVPFFLVFPFFRVTDTPFLVRGDPVKHQLAVAVAHLAL